MFVYSRPEELGVGVADVEEVLAPGDEGGQRPEELVGRDVVARRQLQQPAVPRQHVLERALEADAHLQRGRCGRD